MLESVVAHAMCWLLLLLLGIACEPEGVRCSPAAATEGGGGCCWDAQAVFEHFGH